MSEERWQVFVCYTNKKATMSSSHLDVIRVGITRAHRNKCRVWNPSFRYYYWCLLLQNQSPCYRFPGKLRQIVQQYFSTNFEGLCWTYKHSDRVTKRLGPNKRPSKIPCLPSWSFIWVTSKYLGSCWSLTKN